MLIGDIMINKINVAAIQMRCTDNVQENIKKGNESQVKKIN